MTPDRSPHESRLRRRSTHLTLAALGAVLVVFAGLALGGAVLGSRSAEDARRSGDLASTYLRTLDAMSREDTVEDVYADQPSMRLQVRFGRAAADLERALGELERLGGPRDRSLARSVLPLHRRYADAMTDYFAAIDRGDPDRAEAIDEERSDDAQDAFQPLLNGAGPDYAIEQLRGIDAMASTQGRVLRATLVAVPIGALLYLLVLALFAAQRRRADAAVQAELGTLRAALREDHLTGLRNHRALHEDLALAGAAEAGAHALALVDLVDLKAYNDLDGYVAGDERLRAFARTTHAVIAGRGRCYRLGGDDFVVLLPDHGSLSALALLEEIRVSLAAEGHGAVRVGVAEGSLEAGSTELLRRGDVALAAARRTRRPAVVYASDLELEAERVASGEDEALTALTTALAQAVDAKDPYTRSHCETVSAVAALVAEQLGLPRERVARVRLAGLMHDVGKIGIPDAILNKPGKLDAAEWEIMRSHAALGRDILAAAGLEEEAEWVQHHHERVDGGGYPDGLAGDAVPLESRIILTADTFEAITSDRSYRRGRSEAEALAELRRHAGRQFDPACVAALEAVLAARVAVAERALMVAAA